MSAASQQDIRSITQLVDAEVIGLTPRSGELVSVAPTVGDAAATVPAVASPAVAAITSRASAGR